MFEQYNCSPLDTTWFHTYQTIHTSRPILGRKDTVKVVHKSLIEKFVPELRYAEPIAFTMSIMSANVLNIILFTNTMMFVSSRSVSNMYWQYVSQRLVSDITANELTETGQRLLALGWNVFAHRIAYYCNKK